LATECRVLQSKPDVPALSRIQRAIFAILLLGRMIIPVN